MLTLHQVFRVVRHVIPQVIESELIIRPESNIRHIRFTTLRRIRLMSVDTIHRKTVEHIQRSHPFRVTFCQIVIYGHHVYPPARKGIQEYRQGRYQSFTFSGRHLGNLSLVQYRTTDQLYIVVHHIPGYFIPSCDPGVEINGLISFDLYKIMLYRQITVELIGCHFDLLVLLEAAGSFFHHGKSSG